MSKYELLAVEECRTVFDVEADSFYEAKNELEKQIDSGKIVLDDFSSYNRTWLNNHSKMLTDRLNILIYYNPKNHTLTVSHNDNSMEYLCITVEDIIYCVKTYCHSFLEDKEITIDSLENNNIALRSGHKFYIDSKNKIAFMGNLIKTEDTVYINGEKLDVYCAKNYQGELDINSRFIKATSYLMKDYLVDDNEMEM